MRALAALACWACLLGLLFLLRLLGLCVRCRPALPPLHCRGAWRGGLQNVAVLCMLHRIPCPMARQSLWGTCSPRDDQMWPALPPPAPLCARRWDYVTRFAAECDMGKKEYGTECSEKVRGGWVRPSQCRPLRVQRGHLLHVGNIVGPHHVWYRGGGAVGVWEKVWGGEG